MKTALIIVDFQKDFCSGSSLAIPGGERILLPIKNALTKMSFDLIVASQDWHPDDHSSFETWPKHCVQNTKGADLFTDFKHDIIVRKGMIKEEDQYSAFEAKTADNVKLFEYLRKNKIKTVFICGLALDYCVKETAIDFVENDFRTYIVLDACRGVDPKTSCDALYVLTKKGTLMTYSESVFSILQELQK